VFPRCDALNAPRPSKRRGCLPPAYIHLVSPVSQYRILTQPNTHPNVLVSPTQSLASYKTPPNVLQTLISANRFTQSLLQP
jgi:hypothetical protein